MIGLAGFGYFFYSKGVLPGLPKVPPTILAATTPAKVQPPSQDSVDAPDAAASLLRKGSGGGRRAREDHQQRRTAGRREGGTCRSRHADAGRKRNARYGPRSAGLAPQDDASGFECPSCGRAAAALDGHFYAGPRAFRAGACPSTTRSAEAAALLAPVPSPTIAAVVAPPTVAANPPAPAFPAPPKQHSVVIRPDGTLVADAAPTRGLTLASVSPTPALVSDAPPAAAQPSTPKLEIAAKPPAKLPTKLSPPKAPAPDPSETTASLGPSDIKSKGAGAAPAVDPGDTTTPASVRPQGDAGTGRWSAQLAAPGSEAEANATLAKLQSQYADALGGATLSVHKADVNGATVYRIRATGLEKSAAVDICGKVKSAGGGCFVAR